MINPPNLKPIKTLWAILSVDKNGNEGLCLLNVPEVGPQLAVTGSERILQVYKDCALRGMGEAKAAGLEIVVAEFTRNGEQKL